MALATKYSLTWKDVENVTWIAVFQEEAWPGAVTALEPGAIPLVLTWHQSSKYQQIIGSTADFQMVYESAIDDLHTEESHTIYVLITKGGANVWKGWLLPGQFHRAFNNPKHHVTITASDGLGDLKSIKFEDASGDPYFTQDDELQVLADCLDKTEQTLTVRSAVNIYETNHTVTTAHTPLNQTYLYPEMYWDEQTDERSNCDQPISDILFKYGATIRQSSGGIWYILRPNSFSVDDIYYRESVSGSTTGSGNYTSYISIDSDNYYINSDQDLTKLAGLGRCEVTQEPPRRSNILKNGSFRTFTEVGLTVGYWTNVNSPAWAMEDDVLRMSNNESSSVPTAYITCLQNITQANTIRLRFDYDPAYTGTPTYNDLYLYIIFGGKYLTTSGWSSSALPYIIPITSQAAAKADIDLPAFYAGSNSFPTGEDLYIRIYEYYNETAQGTPWDNFIEFSNMRLEIDSGDADCAVYSYDNPASISYIKEVTMNMGDSFQSAYTLDDEHFINTYAADRTHLTQFWSIYGDPTADATISEVLARQTVEGYRRSLDMISGSIRSANLDFPHKAIEDSNFKDEYGYNKRFFPNGISYNTRLNEWNGSWVECPATYNTTTLCDAWASENFGSAGTITGNLLEIVYYNITSTSEFGVFESYTTAAHEWIRFVINIVDRGGNDALPIITISDGVTPHTQTVSEGLNYLTYEGTGANAVTLVLSGVVGEILDITCEVDFYHLTGI